MKTATEAYVSCNMYRPTDYSVVYVVWLMAGC